MSIAKIEMEGFGIHPQSEERIIDGVIDMEFVAEMEVNGDKEGFDVSIPYRLVESYDDSGENHETKTADMHEADWTSEPEDDDLRAAMASMVESKLKSRGFIIGRISGP